MSNEQALHRLTDDIRMRGLSQRTEVIYVTVTRKFFEYCQVPIDELTTEHIRSYLKHLISLGLAPGTVNKYAAGIRFFFAVTLDRYLNYLQVPRMKHPKKLPQILSLAETEALLAACSDVRSRAFILLAYGSGLRIGEIVRLKVSDIRSKDEMRLFIRDTKGQKDRYTILSQNTLLTLRAYWREARPQSPGGYLFPGSTKAGHLCTNAVSYALGKALHKAGISTKVTFHSLRHGFATRLLEDGYTIMQIKELLGHASIKSTTIYLHLADTTKGIVSPADVLPIAVAGGA